jgi:hypothetical protein
LDLKKFGENPPENIIYIGDFPKNVERAIDASPNFFFFKMKNERYIKLRGHIEEAELVKPETKDSSGDPSIFVAKRGRSTGQTGYYPL